MYTPQPMSYILSKSFMWKRVRKFCKRFKVTKGNIINFVFTKTYKAVHSGGSQPGLQRSTGYTCCLLHACLLLGLTLDPYDGGAYCFETSLDVHRTTRRYIR